MRGLLIASLPLFSLLPFSVIAAPPPDLNQQLLSAVCSSNWSGAIRVVDSMLLVAPGHRAELTTYRAQLLAIANSGASFSSPVCGSGSRSVASPAPKPAFSSSSPASPLGANQGLQDYSDSIRP